MNRHAIEIAEGKRFEFGKNWAAFLSALDDNQIAHAKRSLQAFLEVDGLVGRSFLDIGCGSGLFSLAARQLGARVHSIDFDPKCVACTAELKRRYSPGEEMWTIQEGSVLDGDYLRSLGTFDIVYSWGVLHHTGDMWQALANASIPVAPHGRLFIAIYNDQGSQSKRWRTLKRLYCSSSLGKVAVVSVFLPFYFLRGLVADALRARNPLARYREYTRESRGMSAFRDWFDWLGGYPFEVATPEAIFDFYRKRGYRLQRLKTCGGTHGNNQFVFVKE